MPTEMTRQCRTLAIAAVLSAACFLSGPLVAVAQIDTSGLPPHGEQHPLYSGWTKNVEAAGVLANVQDYQAVFVKRERVNGELLPTSQLMLKVREKPFSVYIRILSPEAKAGTEAIYVQGANQNKVVAHSTGLQKLLGGTMLLDPTGSWAMDGQRYPITEAGLSNLVRRMLNVSREEMKYGESQVQEFAAKVDGRDCTCVQIVHPYRRSVFNYFVVRNYYDNEWKLPVRNEVYDWPEKAGDPPVLMGEYTYTQLRFNLGFTDKDFDPKNPEYEYP